MFRTFLTQRDAEVRLTEQPAQPLGKTADPGLATVFIDPTRSFQTIEGFGGAFTQAGASVWKKLSPANQKKIVDAYFDFKTGHGYTLCRTHIDSCDFSESNYAYDEVAGDTSLAHFSIEKDEEALLPLIKAAQATSKFPIKLLGTPWSPPSWMKTNGQMNHGGSLKPEYRQTWANYFVRYVQEYKKRGVNIWGLTVQNEPQAVSDWDNCVYSPEELRDFIRDNLGPTLLRAGMQKIRLMGWDHNRDNMVEYSDVLYSDPEASRYVWGTAYHWYSDGGYDNMTLHHDAWPEKPMLASEACQDLGPHVGDWGMGERYGSAIINDLNRWSVGWVDWNMLLDMRGGPNHANNFCSAPILVDVAKGTVEFQSTYYYLGHFARFIRPGAKRILCSSSNGNLSATAGVNTDGTVAVVVMNRSDGEMRFNLKSLRTASTITLSAHSIATYLLDARSL